MVLAGGNTCLSLLMGFFFDPFLGLAPRHYCQGSERASEMNRVIFDSTKRGTKGTRIAQAEVM